MINTLLNESNSGIDDKFIENFITYTDIANLESNLYGFNTHQVIYIWSLLEKKIEQINKGNDTSKKSKIIQLLLNIKYLLLSDENNGIQKYFLYMNLRNKGKITKTYMDMEYDGFVIVTENGEHKFDIRYRDIENIFKQIEGEGSLPEIAESILKNSQRTQKILESSNELKNEEIVGSVARDELCNTEEAAEKLLFNIKQKKGIAFSRLGILEDEGWLIEGIDNHTGIKVSDGIGNNDIYCNRFKSSLDGKYYAIIDFHYPAHIKVYNTQNRKIKIIIKNITGEINQEEVEFASIIAEQGFIGDLERDEENSCFKLIERGTNKETFFDLNGINISDFLSEKDEIHNDPTEKISE